MKTDRSARAEAAFVSGNLHRDARSAMARYSEDASAVADHLATVAGSEAARQFRFGLEDVRFSYALADHSMEEILIKHELVAEGLLAPAVFRALAGSARVLLGSRAEQSERVRGAEESRRLLANESERLEAERSSITSEIEGAELAVRTAVRHHRKTAIRAPIQGTLAGDPLS